MTGYKTFKSREEWLKNRQEGIGGSDIAAVIGQNPWLSNVELWEIKTGRRLRKDISDKDVVKYGQNAEKHIRALFELDHPEYTVGYEDNNSWHSDKYPWALASLDGWLLDKDLRRGVLEIKTTEIQKAGDWEKWNESIPNNYFCQVLFYMAVTEAEFAELRAYIRYTDKDGERKATVRDYHIERADFEEDIHLLMESGAEFWELVESDIRPSAKLPEI